MHILLLEDSADDAELITHALRKAGFLFTFERVDDLQSFEACLKPKVEKQVDLVLSDYALPGFSGLQALEILQDRAPEIPFILVSGAISEDLAVAALKCGVTDYLLKDRLGRLRLAITHALEQRRTTASLLSAAQLLKGTIDALPEHIAVLDFTGQILMVNQAWIEFAQANASSENGKNDENQNENKEESFHHVNYLEVCRRSAQRGSRDAGLFADGIQEVISGVRPHFEMEYACHSPTEQRWFIGKASCFGRGDEARIVVAHENITSRKRAEIELQENETRFRSLVEYSTDVISISDAEGIVRYHSPSGQRVSGYTTEDRLGRPVFENIHPEDRPHAFSVWRTALDRPDQILTMELRTKAKDGAWLYAEFTLRNLLDTPGVHGVVVTTRNITDRKKAEEALLAAEQRYHEHLKQVAMVAMMLDTNGTILFCNDFLCRLTGWEAEELQGKNWHELFTPADVRQARSSTYRQAVEAQAIIPQYQTDICTKTGERRTIAWASTWLRDSAGAIVGVACLGEDVTERQRTLATVKRQYDRLEALRSIDLIISSTLELRVILDYLLTQITSLMNVDAVAILLSAPQNHTLTFAGGKGFQLPYPHDPPQPFGVGQAGKAAGDRKTVYIPDISQSSADFHNAQILVEEQFVGYIAKPLIAKGQVVGVLEICHRSVLDRDAEWHDFLDTLAGQTAMAVDNALLFENLQRSNAELLRAYDTTIEGWSRALDLRDRETEGHSERVTDMSLRFADALGLSEEEKVHIRRGALLHDIGKMGVPDVILLKPGPLTDDEFNIMRNHPEAAYALLYPIEFLRPALHIPLFHHEKWDGSGYPFGLAGEQIPLAARLFAIADVWDALRSDRPYRKAWSADRVREHMRSQAGTHFDPNILEKVLPLLGD